MLSRLGQVNHYYLDAYYAERSCGFPQCWFAPRRRNVVAITADCLVCGNAMRAALKAEMSPKAYQVTCILLEMR